MRGRSLGIVRTTIEATSLPSLAFEFLADLRLMISYQLGGVPLDAEWDAYVAAITRAIRVDGERSPPLPLSRPHDPAPIRWTG
jgi:hypothetical protein